MAFYSPLRVHVLAQCRSSLKIYKMLGSLERVGKMQKVFEASAGEIKDKHAAFLFFFVCFFFQCSAFFVHHPLDFCSLTSPAPSDCLAICQSVRPPDGLIQAARGTHGRGGVAVAAVGLHALTLGVQARVHQAVGPSSARGP